jgi:hypothetical protein
MFTPTVMLPEKASQIYHKYIPMLNVDYQIVKEIERKIQSSTATLDRLMFFAAQQQIYQLMEHSCVPAFNASLPKQAKESQPVSQSPPKKKTKLLSFKMLLTTKHNSVKQKEAVQGVEPKDPVEACILKVNRFWKEKAMTRQRQEATSCFLSLTSHCFLLPKYKYICLLLYSGSYSG